MKKGFSLHPILRVVLLSVVFSFLFLTGIAQPGDPQGGVKPDVPISGVEILLGMGLLLGIKRLLNKNSRKI